MSNSWFKFKRLYFSYSRSDRVGLIIISLVLLLSAVVRILIDYLPNEKAGDLTEIKEWISRWEAENEGYNIEEKSLFPFDPNTISSEGLDSLAIPNNVKRNMLAYRLADGTFHSASDVRKVYGMNDSLFALLEEYIVINKSVPEPISMQKSDEKISHPDYFDPNRTSVEELIGIGFNNFQARNMVNYRERGGVFRGADDLLKIYGIDSAFFLAYREFVRIETNDVSETRTYETVRIELNQADSLILMKLPGIGPSYARRIIRYRDLLGGFYSTRQLLEVYGFPEETYYSISELIYTDTLLIKKLRINFMDYSELLRHPYLNKQQVANLLARRDKEGPFKEINELGNIQYFDSVTVRKLSPYVTCR
jgi:DNA uptake protein ComE-like DNA-binding protein